MNDSSYYSNFCSPGASYKIDYIEVDSTVTLRVISYYPPERAALPPVVLLPGLGSVIENFKGTLIGLTQKHIVYYIDTREKGTSKISGNVGFSIPEIASDLPKAIELHGLKTGEYILAGYSLGASVVACSYVHLRQKPMAVVLVEPSASFKWPWWLIPLARYAVSVYSVIKPFLKWYMKTFRINTKEDQEMYDINSRILDQANPKRLAATVLAVRKFEVWEHLPKIDVPCLVVGVSHDKFHSHDEALLVSRRIANCKYIDVLNNKRSHSEEVATIIDEFIESFLNI